MSRRAFHRPLGADPQLPRRSCCRLRRSSCREPSEHRFQLVLPLLSSVGMAAYMVTFGSRADHHLCCSSSPPRAP